MDINGLFARDTNPDGPLKPVWEVKLNVLFLIVNVFNVVSAMINIMLLIFSSMPCTPKKIISSSAVRP